MRIVIGSVPKDSGTFSFYRNLRAGLAGRDVEVFCVSVGRDEAGLWEAGYADDGCVQLVPDARDMVTQSHAFVEWCVQNAIDVVLPINSVAILSAVPHLPTVVRVVSRCANAFDHGYRITISNLERVSKIVAIAPKQLHDLEVRYGVAPEQMCLIPNGVELSRFAENRPSLPSDDVLRLCVLGRLEHGQKGVLDLPGIIHRLESQRVDYRLQIGGKGVHERTLRRRLKREIRQGIVTFVGLVSRESVPAFLASNDALLFPSRFEGCSNVLLEALAAGCVPVASNLPDITDCIVSHEETGLLCSVGDTVAFGDAIARLDKDRELLETMSVQAQEVARKQYSVETMCDSYHRLFLEVTATTPVPSDIRSWNCFVMDHAFARSRWRRIPIPVKRLLKRVLFHLGLSLRYE